MRRKILCLSILLVAPVAAPLAAQRAENSDFIQVVERAERGEMALVIGPVNLPAGASHEAGGHGAMVPLQEIAIPRAGWIHGFEADMVDADGAPLRESFLHHVNVIDPDHRELFSPISRRIMAAGPETGRKELPGSMGLPVEAGHRLLVRAVFHNPGGEPLEDGYLRIRFLFTPARAGDARAGIFPVYLDVRPPVGEKSFDLVPGESEQSWEGSPAVSGRLLGGAGHMHQYGRSLRLEDVTTGGLLWKVEPLTDEEGRILSIPPGEFWKKGGLPLRSDHVYRLTVSYDNPTDEVIPGGGMGTLGGFFLPEPGESWPPVVKDDPLYLADLRHTRGEGVFDGVPADQLQPSGHDDHAGGPGSGGAAPPSERASLIGHATDGS
ncbi:MAG: hypothetical protein ABR599_04080 [Gemmatimonadota bacterium]